MSEHWKLSRAIWTGGRTGDLPARAGAALAEAHHWTGGLDIRPGSADGGQPDPEEVGWAAFVRAWRCQPAEGSPGDAATWAERDVRAGIAAVALAGDGSVGLLTIALGPVQTFIAAARSLRDLWTGSALLSWLLFRALRPVIETVGPSAVIFPALRGAPVIDHWLETEGVAAAPDPSAQDLDRLMVPSLPHRAMALAPWGPDGKDAEALARECETAARDALEKEVAEAVRKLVGKAYGSRASGWDALWDRQVREMLHVQALAVPLPADGVTGGSLPWAAHRDLAGRLMAARRSVRPVPVPDPDPGLAGVPKCTLLGTWEQMGDKDFWTDAPDRLRKDGVRMRPQERFCAPSLVKRFAFPACLGEALGVARVQARFPDTATVAAWDWLDETGLDWQSCADDGHWSGQWLHWDRPNQDKDNEEACPPTTWEAIRQARGVARQQGLGAPPAYYAILVADGDNMGRRLHEQAPTAPDHLALSAAVGGFAVEDVPSRVRDARGRLIYAGGDDVLAVMPAPRALACADSLRRAFERRLHGGTLSVGVAVVHHKADLREALAAARAAEASAKTTGRNRLALTIQRRSGEHATSLLRWADVAWVDRLVAAFRDRASDRWAYRLRALADPLDGMGIPAAAEAELKRQIGRAEQDTLQRLADGLPDGAAINPDDPVKDRAIRAMVAAFRTFCEDRKDDRPPPDTGLAAFAIACQAASFLARARD